MQYYVRCTPWSFWWRGDLHVNDSLSLKTLQAPWFEKDLILCNRSVISIFHPVVLAASAERLTSSSMAVTSQLSLQKNDWFFACKTNMTHRVGLVRFSLGTWAAWLKIYSLRRAATLAKPLQPVWEKESTAPLYLTRVSSCWKSRVHGPRHGDFVLDKLWPRNDTDDSATCIHINDDEYDDSITRKSRCQNGLRGQ